MIAETQSPETVLAVIGNDLRHLTSSVDALSKAFQGLEGKLDSAVTSLRNEALKETEGIKADVSKLRSAYDQALGRQQMINWLLAVATVIIAAWQLIGPQKHT